MRNYVADCTRKILVAGQSGAGKTTLIKALLAQKDRTVVWDIEHEYHGEHIAFADIPLLRRRRAFACVYRPRFARGPEDLPREFEQFVKLLLDYGRNLTVAVDEAVTVLPRHRTGGLGALLLQGRKRGLSVIYATQYLSRLPFADVLIGGAREMMLFHLDGRGSQMVLRSYCSDDTLQRVAELPPHEYLNVRK